MTREQQLVDICFELVLTSLDPAHIKHFSKLSQEEKASWVSKQLTLCGFETTPCGASWGILNREKEK